MRVVIATDDRKNMNGHFARCQVFMFYEVMEDTCDLVSEVCFSAADSDIEHLKYSNRKSFCVEERINVIKGSDVIFVSAIGGPVADRVIANDVYPIEMNAAESIESALSKLQELLRGRKPLWLQRILRHDFMFEGPVD
jgi:nitrogen fixation protein NifX